MAKVPIPEATRKGSKLTPQKYTDEVELHNCDAIPQPLILMGVIQIARFKGVPGILVRSPATDSKTGFSVRYCPWCGKDAGEWL